MKDIKAKILSNEKVGADYYKMTLDASYIAKTAKPGQFVQVRCGNGVNPLLRRPLSIHGLKAQAGIKILYEVVGKGTEILSGKTPGEFMDALGPLGNGFSLPRNTKYKTGNTILIAGGIGAAPLVFLAEELARKKIKTTVLIGARTKNQVLCEKDFRKLGAEARIATDDGSCGYKGFVSGLFSKFLRDTRRETRDTVYACGPNPMLKSVAAICSENKIDCEVSLEEKMACGFGACLGCAVKVKGHGYKLACKDGPVFKASEIIW